MPSPPRPPRGSPPRRALHERSDSQTNERNKSTLRMVEDSIPYIYGESPYPVKSSQVLLPSGQYPSHEPTLRGRPHEEVPLGDTSRLPQEEEPSKEPRVAGSRQGSDAGWLTNRSSADLSFYTASARDSTGFTTPGQDRRASVLSTSRLGPSIRKVTDEAPPFMTLESQPQPENAGSSTFPSPLSHQTLNKDSDDSLSSTGTIIVKKTRDGKKRVSYSAFPQTGRPSSSRSNLATPASHSSNTRIADQYRSPESPVSPVSPVSPIYAASPERRTASTPTRSKNDSPTRIQYPIIKPASASGSWAESTVAAPQVPPRALERAQKRWNPHLSTVQSERSSTTSGGRSSQTMWLPDSSRASKASSNVLSPRMSSNVPTLPSRNDYEGVRSPTGETGPSPGPFTNPAGPAPVRQRDTTGSTIRMVNDRDEDALKIPSTIPGSRDSENVQPKTPDDRQAGAISRPGSRASFFRDSIPAWARTYYARPMSSSSGLNRRDSTATDNISINIFRTHDRGAKPPYDRRQSGLNMHPVGPEDLNSDGNAQRRVSPSWSPHLWHDRTSLGRRRTIFQRPFGGEVFDDRALTERNVQVVMFMLGYIFPFSWFIAAFLPLPPNPDVSPSESKGKGKDQARQSEIAVDLEKQLGPTDLARYETARWWRSINRVMCAVGVMVIVIIVGSPFSWL